MEKMIRYILDSDYREKMKLVQQMRSKDNLKAINAANTLRKNRERTKKIFSLVYGKKWTNLTGEDFNGANLESADLSDLDFCFENANLSYTNLKRTNLKDTLMDYVNLFQADLRYAYMEEIHLLGANLRQAKLQGAQLIIGHLHGADFSFANLKEANLRDARMMETNFFNANMEDVNLEYAKLINANLENARFGNNFFGTRYTFPTLPDGTKFTTVNDLERFTNRNHPEFWRPKAPVVWGDGSEVKKRNSPSHLDLSVNIHNY